MAPSRPLEALRGAIVGRVRDAFNEGGRDSLRPPPPSDTLFEKDSPIRMVHADVVGMLVGGMRGLFLQMLHPHALQGVLDFSNFRSDMHGRLQRTASFIATTTFGDRERAMGAIDRVNRIHAKVGGTLPDGSPYSAADPRTLAWVHVAEATSFLAAYLRLVRPAMPGHEQDEYYRQFAIVARALGADPVPETRNEAEAVFRELKADLRPGAQAREVARLVLDQRPEGVPRAAQIALGQEAIALLPDFARDMLGLEKPPLHGMASRAAALGMGRTLRWAFRQ